MLFLSSSIDINKLSLGNPLIYRKPVHRIRIVKQTFISNNLRCFPVRTSLPHQLRNLTHRTILLRTSHLSDCNKLWRTTDGLNNCRSHNKPKCDNFIPQRKRKTLSTLKALTIQIPPPTLLQDAAKFHKIKIA